MKPVALFVIIVTFLGRLAAAQNACPCVPVTQVWTVETCGNWNCAASAVIMANGDPHILTLPAPSNDGRWLVLKRVNTGSYVAPADGPFALESFDGFDGASARFTAVASTYVPMIMSVPDGKFVVVMSREPLTKHRAAAKP
jgi:hypothetical protein